MFDIYRYWFISVFSRKRFSTSFFTNLDTGAVKTVRSIELVDTSWVTCGSAGKFLLLILLQFRRQRFERLSRQVDSQLFGSPPLPWCPRSISFLVLHCQRVVQLRSPSGWDTCDLLAHCVLRPCWWSKQGAPNPKRRSFFRHWPTSEDVRMFFALRSRDPCGHFLLSSIQWLKRNWRISGKGASTWSSGNSTASPDYACRLLTTATTSSRSHQMDSNIQSFAKVKI